MYPSKGPFSIPQEVYVMAHIKNAVYAGFASLLLATSAVAGKAVESGGTGTTVDKQDNRVMDICTNGATWHCGDDKLGDGNGFNCGGVYTIEASYTDQDAPADAATIAGLMNVSMELVQACIDVNSQ